MIVVTGGAGFIGSNLVKYLNQQGRNDILVVDDLTDGTKFKNISDCEIFDYLDIEDFLNRIQNNIPFEQPIEVVFHQGACSATTEWDGRLMMKNNYEYSKSVLEFCTRNKIPFIYASSAAVYGSGKAGFIEKRECEQPLNVYGYSKFQFDQYIRQHQADFTSQVIGLRYFNVYGPREQHKGSMASVAFHHHNQLENSDVVKLFIGSDGYGNGEQRRDFIYVEDVAKVNYWLFKHPEISGIFNVGTGRSETFNAVANAVIARHQRGKIEYIPFPPQLVGRYQSFTEADISALRRAGYNEEFKTVQQGVNAYLDWLEQKK